MEAIITKALNLVAIHTNDELMEIDTDFIKGINTVVTLNANKKYNVYYCTFEGEVFEKQDLTKSKAYMLGTLLYCNINSDYIFNETGFKADYSYN